MTDTIDEANAAAEAFLAWAMARRQAVRVEAMGVCLCCDDPVAAGRRWCSAECSRLWEAEQARQRRLEAAQ